MGRLPIAACALAALAALPAPARSAPPKAAVNLFEDVTDLTTQLKKAVAGRVMIDELTLYQDSASIDIQDPRRKENIDRYKYDDGKLEEPEPVKLSGDYTQADLDAGVFALDSVDFSLIPTMIQDARTRLKMPDGKVGALTLKRGFPFYNDVRWQVSVSDARHTGSVWYDLKGRKKDQSKD
jgi:hypothetical protein